MIFPSISPFTSVSSYFMYLGAPILGAYMLTNVISSSCTDPFIIIECPSLSFFMVFVLKSILSVRSIATPAFLSFPFAWNFFHHFSFNLYVSFALKWFSCRQHIVGSCFIGQSATLCLLIGAFSPLTFKLIIVRYDFIAILNLVFQLILYFFFVPFFFFLFFILWFNAFLLYYTCVLFFFLFLWIYCMFLICGYPVFQVY